MKKVYIALGICVLFCTSVALTDMNVSVSDEIADNYLYDRLQQQDNEPTFEPQEDPVWFNASWSYRKEINVTNNRDDYQTEILISQNNDATDDVDCEGHCNNNFSDLRFACANGTLVPYWIEEYTSGDDCTAWINNSYNDTTLYLYYGNDAAESTSNGKDTFLFFDDAETGNQTDRWSAGSYSSSRAYEGTYSIHQNEDSVDADIEATSNALVCFKRNTNTYSDLQFYASDSTRLMILRHRSSTLEYYTGSWHHIDSYSSDIWHDMRFHINSDSNTVTGELDGSSLNSGNDISQGNSFDDIGKICYRDLVSYNTDNYIDNVFVALWTPETEPIFTFSNEQIQLDNWLHNRKITINSSQISSNLTNFPVCINITDAHLASKAQSDGDDILFTADNITKLNHEIELYNSSTGQLVAWVNITDLSGTEDTTIYMYYGNATCSNQENAEDVWDENYVGVYHMDDASGGISDSTSKSNDGTEQGNPTYQQKEGIGYSIDFDGTGDFFTLPDFSEYSGDFDYSFEIWAKIDSFTNNLGLMSLMGQYQTDIWYNSADNDIEFHYREEAGDAQHYLELLTDNPDNNTHHYYAGTLDFDTIAKGFHNGSITETDSTISTLHFRTDDDNCIGELYGSGTYTFTGSIDEVRYSANVRSDDWIATTYNTMNNATDGGFFDLAPMSNQFTAWEYNRSITFNSSQIPSNLTNFPVCINITDTHIKNNAQADGDDILFTADNVTKLNHEIELYNSTTGHLVAWVNVTELSGSSDTTIYMYYGNATCSNQENVADVWDTNYVLIHHMNSTFDSTSNENILTEHDGATSGAVGKIANCYHLDGTNDYLSWADNTFTNIDNSTIELYAKLDDTPSAYNTLFHLDSDWSYFSLVRSNETMEFGINDGSGWKRNFDDGFTTGNWVYYAQVEASSTSTLYKNGDEIGSVGYDGSILSNTGGNYLGSYSPHDDGTVWDGFIDEVRYSTISRSSNWIATTYNTMNNATDGGFFELEPMEATNTAPNTPTSPQCQNQTWSDTDHLIDHTPYFNWTFSDSDTNDTQHGFQIQVIADEAPFGSYMWNYTENTSNEFVIYNGSALQDGALYNWKVRVKDNDSAWSDYTANQQFRMNSLPTTPSLSSPGNNSKNLPYTPHSINLTWTAASDAETDSLNYWWQYARDSDFTIDVNGGWSTGPTYKTIPQTENLLEQTDYYWRVRAWDGHENGTWSNWRTFETDEIIDLTDLSIADGAENISIDTTLWEINITHNDGYAFDWWINTTPDVGNNSHMSDTDGIKNTTLSNLWYNTTYSVQVVVNGAQGAKRNETYTFTTEAFYDDAASPPTNVQVNQTTNSSLNLTWANNGNNRTIIIRNETGSAAYNTDLVNATELYNGTGTQFEDTDLTQGITYYYTFWSYNETTSLYSATYAQANNTVKVLSLSISISPHTYDFASITIPGTKQSTEYTFNITNDGLDASIAINVSNSQNWSFVNFSDRGLDAFCMNWSDDNWTSEQNIKTTGTTITSNLIFDMNKLFDLRLISPIALSKSSQQEQWTITITATPS